MTLEAGAFVDADARARIATSGLGETLFVEAGAGTGKTFQLVERVVNLVLHEGVALRHIAAITFTEAAGAELRDRIRQRFEEILDEGPDTAVHALAEAALADSDIAAIGTLHAFALRILGEHPLDVGLPPRVEVLDEVSSQLAFEDRWRTFVDELYDDVDAEDLLLSAAMLKVDIEGNGVSASLKDAAAIFSDNWDRLAVDGIDLGPLPPLDWGPLEEALADLIALLPACTNPADKLYERITTLVEPEVRELMALPDRYRQLQVLVARSGRWRRGRGGSGKCWPEVDRVKEAVDAVDDAAAEVRQAAVDDVLQRLGLRVARFTRAEAERRRREGRLEFHDLLVLARELVRTSGRARAALHERYQRLLLDEFQDTDPIQIEVAARIAAAVVDGDVVPSWEDVAVEAGRLFFVGDPKQSIYRFRRADITLFMDARDAFAAGAPVPLVQNFRTVAPILAWVNHVFTAVMPEEVPGAQPAYRPLHATRTDLGGDHRVVLLGGERPRDTKAAALRAEEAADVARAIATIRDHPDQWPVEDTDGDGADDGGGGTRWRPARLSDVTILLPTRTSLGHLEEALDAVGLPYRVDTGTLVYDTQEVRDALSALRAIDDPTDEIALVAALRSPLYACSDVDLFTFVEAGGRWSLRRTPPAGLPPEHPVPAALAHLRALSDERWWVEPSALLLRLLEERQAFALGLGHRRPREVWRRLRFLVDQAREFEESGGTGLRAFLRWAALQGQESSRVHEPLLPETDDEAVSIKTVHGAKGLEFPITVVSGLTTQQQRGRRGVTVLWEGDRAEIAIRKDTATANFDRQAEQEAEMDEHERQRLLYVACTRARDHLVVCTHHLAGVASHGATLATHSAAVADELCRTLPDDTVVDVPVALPTRSPVPDAGAGAPASPDADDDAEWAASRAALLDRARRSRFTSATGVARLAQEHRPASGAAPPEDEDEDAPADLLLDDEEGGEPADGTDGAAFRRRRGRAGTAVGRSVHATLQFVDLATGRGLAELAFQQAQAEAIPELAETVAALARSAIEAEVVQAAVASGRWWRELYLAAPLGAGAVEGYIDLLVEGPDGLVIVDYKTDRVSGPAAVDAKLEQYGLQLATYAEALHVSTGLSVARGVLLFCQTGAAIEREVADLDGARAEVRALLAAPA